MGFLGWIGQNWFTLLSAAGIGGGLWYNALSSKAQTKTQQLTNVITLTQSHRQLWRDFHGNPKLIRVLDATAEVSMHPVTPGEQDFVVSVIQHLSSVHRAILMGLTIKPDGMPRDVTEFFSLPVPNAVWSKVKSLQDANLVQFVEACLRGIPSDKISGQVAFK